MSSLAGRRKRALIATIVSDPYRKLAAIALALGLWYFLNSQISRPIEVRMSLTWGQPGTKQLGVMLGDEKVVGTRFYDNEGSDLEYVTLSLYGQSADVDRAESGLALTVSSFENGIDWNTREYVEFTANDLGPPPQLRGLTVTMKPAVVRLNVQPVIELPRAIKYEDVELDYDNTDDLAQRLRKDTAKFSPETAIITGPKNSIEDFQRRIGNGMRPFKARISSKRIDKDVLTSLALNAPENSGLTFERIPTMAIRIDPLTEEWKLNVLIVVDDLALPESERGQYVVDGDDHRVVPIKAGGGLLSQLVSLKGEGDAKLEEWAEDHLRLTVWIAALDPQITPPPELTQQAELRLHGPLYSRVDSSDYSLAEPVPIILRRRKQ